MDKYDGMKFHAKSCSTTFCTNGFFPSLKIRQILSQARSNVAAGRIWPVGPTLSTAGLFDPWPPLEGCDFSKIFSKQSSLIFGKSDSDSWIRMNLWNVSMNLNLGWKDSWISKDSWITKDSWISKDSYIFSKIHEYLENY